VITLARMSHDVAAALRQLVDDHRPCLLGRQGRSAMHAVGHSHADCAGSQLRRLFLDPRRHRSGSGTELLWIADSAGDQPVGPRGQGVEIVLVEEVSRPD
jgi:hypothetical protein